jgi:hypothetical protein
VAELIQVEIKTGTTHTMTWLDAALKPNRAWFLSARVIRAP